MSLYTQRLRANEVKAMATKAEKKMFYTTLITKDGYIGAQAHSFIKDALTRMKEARYRRSLVVLRDGETGKRYSFAEACQLPTQP